MLKVGGPWDEVAHYGHVLATLLRAAWIEYERDHARYLAVAMIYYALVSLVPVLSLLLAALLAVEAGFGPDLSATITRLLNSCSRSRSS